MAGFSQTQSLELITKNPGNFTMENNRWWTSRSGNSPLLRGKSSEIISKSISHMIKKLRIHIDFYDFIWNFHRFPYISMISSESSPFFTHLSSVPSNVPRVPTACRCAFHDFRGGALGGDGLQMWPRGLLRVWFQRPQKLAGYEDWYNNIWIWIWVTKNNIIMIYGYMDMTTIYGDTMGL